MFLNKKSLNILNLFLTLKKYTFLELEEILKIKKRSIASNIETINDFLYNHNINGIIKDETFLYIQKKEVSKIKNLLSHAPFSSTERRDYILLKLFFTDKIILTNYSKELDIGRRTLNYDLEKLKDYLNTFNLKLESIPGKGIFLVGNEPDIRLLFSNFLTKYFIEKEKCHNLFINLINHSFSKKEISLVKKIVLNLINKMRINLATEDFYKIVSIILIHSFREVNFPNPHFNYSTSTELSNNKHYKILMNFLIKHGLEDLRDYELDCICNLILSLDSEKYLYSIEKEVKLFLEKIQEKLNIQLNENMELLMHISNVIRIGKFKAELNFLEHKELHKLENSYRKYFLEINSIIKEILPKFYLEDIIYLTILIKNTVDQISTIESKPKNIAIIDDSFNHVYGKILLKYIKGNYYVNILRILDHYEISDFLKKETQLDFLLTLNEINIQKSKVPTIKMDFNYILNNIYELEKHGFLKK